MKEWKTETVLVIVDMCVFISERRNNLEHADQLTPVLSWVGE